VLGWEHTLPDPDMDVSVCMLASIELGIKSVIWTMVKDEPVKDTGFKDLADSIDRGCKGLPEVVPLHNKQYLRVRDKLSPYVGGQDCVPKCLVTSRL
jgi:hypothetical protein